MEHDLAASVSALVLQLAVILLAAKLGAEIAERWLRQPPVLGELAAGMLIGPYALGGVPLPLLGPLFPPPATGARPGQLPVSTELYALGQVAAVVLLFVAGLETDFGQFLRFGLAAGAVAAGGVVLPFALGAGATVALGLATSPLEPAALFMGAVLTATSVGITARVLADLGRLDTPEGVTILAAAVIDDVLGILVLAMVVGLATAGTVAPVELGLVGLRALAFWLLLVAIAILVAEPLARLFARFQGEGALVPLVLAIGFLGAALAQAAGLALIIGAYSMGLAFSRVRTAAALRHALRPVYHLLVPIFFVVIGMLVDLPAMSAVLLFGAVITLLAILGKVVGCGAIALAVGFNRLGALRVGLGMLPRGEVALIIAGVGLTAGAIHRELFGVAVMMTMVTTLLAPPLLVGVFRAGGAGWRAAPAASTAPATAPAPAAERRYRLVLPSGLAAAFVAHLISLLVHAGGEQVLSVEEPEGDTVIEFRRGEALLSLRRRPVSGDQEVVELESEAAGWEPLLVAAVRATALEARAALEEAARAVGDPALSAALTQALAAAFTAPAEAGQREGIQAG
jgi:Kef-type K+ transport system membrane component KefB